MAKKELNNFTRVTISIRDGQVTWMQQDGDRLPEEQWEKLNIAVTQAFG